MIKRVKENGYVFKHPFGSVVADGVEVGVSATGRRSLAAMEIDRLSRLAALTFLEKNYRKAMFDSEFTLTPSVVQAIIALLDVNQVEFASLIGCQKAKVSKILKSEQAISRSQALLALERLAIELARPGCIGVLLGKEGVKLSAPVEAMVEAINRLRFHSVKKSA